MGLLSKVLAVGVGYVLAKPEARHKLVELARHPQVTQLRGRAQDLVTDGVRTAKRQLSRSSATDRTDAAGSTTAAPDGGVSTLSPSSRPADRAALTKGVLPPAAPIE